MYSETFQERLCNTYLMLTIITLGLWLVVQVLPAVKLIIEMIAALLTIVSSAIKIIQFIQKKDKH